MKTPQEQYLVFTGLDGAILDANPDTIQEVLPALELLRSRNVPLIATSLRTAAEVLPIVKSLDLPDPFIVEGGGAIYIPEDALKIGYKFQKTADNYRVIEFGTHRASILKKLVRLRQDQGFNLIGFSELTVKQASNWGDISPEEIRAAQAREYSEPVLFQGSAEELGRLNSEIESQRLRIMRFNRSFLLTGENDEGNAARFLTQLYREEFQGKSVVSIGLGDNHLSTSLLYAVDIPVLVRRPDGKFDDQVGRFGMKFTRNPGPIGWSQAVIALITEDPEA